MTIIIIRPPTPALAAPKIKPRSGTAVRSLSLFKREDVEAVD
jgi:hypothetical protein